MEDVQEEKINQEEQQRELESMIAKQKEEIDSLQKDNEGLRKINGMVS